MAETPTPHTGIVPIASIQNVIDSTRNLRFSGVVTSIILVTASLPITKLCLGTLYKKQCSAQTPIPIWLVTSGFRGLLCIFVILSILGFAMLTDRYCRKTSSSLLLFVGTLVIVISAFFNFSWSIVGIYWSTSIRSTVQHTDPTQTQTYCHSTPYTFVMAVSLFQAITILIFIVICVIYIRRALPTMITYSNSQAVHQAHKHSNSIASARLWIVGLGQFVVTINGKSVSNGVLNPGYVDWNKTLEYSTYDVTPALQTGDNVLGVVLEKVELYEWKQPNDCIRLESSWYGGEEYDARKELPGWDTPSYDHST
ncbi:unnamed protein product [Adineta ricciae]|uniref:Bacterial alpha-L-rhamnosidase N-terminal domain-containing protein n=1 Tax=Adineta ricciae TaxID=249248 RepID=A0A815XAG9_ADIRI|nr:unnamed protein product [Adineta ricciae]CAF1555081.1 unnamed protein product [Adineta ricciae]